MKTYWLLERADMSGAFYIKDLKRPTTDHNQAIKFEHKMLADDWKAEHVASTPWLEWYEAKPHNFVMQ